MNMIFGVKNQVTLYFDEEELTTLMKEVKDKGLRKKLQKSGVNRFNW